MSVESEKKAHDESTKTRKLIELLGRNSLEGNRQTATVTPKYINIDTVRPMIPTAPELKYIEIPTVPELEHLEPIKPPSHEEINSYQSASVLMQALSAEALLWKNKLPPNFRPAILALLYGGIQINVENLSQVSFHGIQIIGTLNDGSTCSLFAHQSSVQLLCCAQEITEEKPARTIGFIWGSHDIEI